MKCNRYSYFRFVFLIRFFFLIIIIIIIIIIITIIIIILFTISLNIVTSFVSIVSHGNKDSNYCTWDFVVYFTNNIWLPKLIKINFYRKIITYSVTERLVSQEML